MKRKLYIAYGSNLNMDQMLHRCPNAVKICSTTIQDYKLLFRGNASTFGVATIEPAKGESVPVGIWSITSSDEHSLDLYEGWPHLYRKKTIPVSINGETVPAMAYVMTPGHRIARPYQRYLETIKQGYEDFGFDIEPLMKAAERRK